MAGKGSPSQENPFQRQRVLVSARGMASHLARSAGETIVDYPPMLFLHSDSDNESATRHTNGLPRRCSPEPELLQFNDDNGDGSSRLRTLVLKRRPEVKTLALSWTVIPSLSLALSRSCVNGATVDSWDSTLVLKIT